MGFGDRHNRLRSDIRLVISAYRLINLHITIGVDWQNLPHGYPSAVYPRTSIAYA
jgi:hypothetical protein